jgi:hypothetical protein
MKYINKIEEAFQAGKAEKLIGKLINVMRRTIKKPILYTTIEKDYMNTEGKFKGFLSYIPTMKLFFRINFKLTSSDEIVSLDFYNDMIQFKKGYPSFTVDTTGLNIVQIIDVFEDNIEDIKNGNVTFDDDFAHDIAFGESVEKITEKGIMDRQQQLFNMWVDEDKEALKKLSTQRMADVYADFLGADSYNAEIKNLPTFVKFAKQLLFSKGMTNPTFRAKRKGKKEKNIENQAKADELADIVENMAWEDKFEILENSVEAVVNGWKQSLIVYGQSGVGKSEAVYAKLSELGVDYKLFKGGIKGEENLFSILKKYNDNSLLVFDDLDTMLTKKSQNMTNILKAALENKPLRQITWKDKILEFSSGIIFISNLRTFDEAILNRSLAVRIDLTNEQMIDRIDSILEKYHPEIPMDMKKQALAYSKELASGISGFSIRTYENVLVAMQLNPKKWKSTALFLLQSGGA